MPRWYYVLIFSAIKWISTAGLVVVGIIAVCMLLDWLGHMGWGYQWYSPLALAAFAAVAVVIHKGATFALRKQRQFRSPIRTV
jgi:predicted tellurium resistance membrane protein TerC